jgi:hypothetical protein
MSSQQKQSAQKQPASSQQHKRMQQFQQTQGSYNASRLADHSPRVADHQFFTKMPDVNSVENDLIKLLNDFSDTRLKHGTNELHEKLFKKLDAIRDKQENIAKIHFDQDTRLSQEKYLQNLFVFIYLI